jgi:hypothetical protein
MTVAFCLGILVGAAVGVLLMGALTAWKRKPHVSDAEAGELATRFLKDLGFQRACYNYSARAPERACNLPAMAAALDAYENARRVQGNPEGFLDDSASRMLGRRYSDALERAERNAKEREIDE